MKYCVKTTKRCGRCRTVKTPYEFPRNKAKADGLGDWCKECVHAYDVEKRAKVKISKVGGKACNRCKTEKPVTDFYLSPNMADGLEPTCKECRYKMKKARTILPAKTHIAATTRAFQTFEKTDTAEGNEIDAEALYDASVSDVQTASDDDVVASAAALFLMPTESTNDLKLRGIQTLTREHVAQLLRVLKPNAVVTIG